jgi:hypothetical protein
MLAGHSQAPNFSAIDPPPKRLFDYTGICDKKSIGIITQNVPPTKSNLQSLPLTKENTQSL